MRNLTLKGNAVQLARLDVVPAPLRPAEGAMIHIVLLEPEIPMNTGNIARTCAATGSKLHLIKPLGFDISDRAVKRAGLDYWDMVSLAVYDDLDGFFRENGDGNLWLATTKAPRRYTDVAYTADCFLLFGKETRGLPRSLRERFPERCVRLPMRAGARSLNLANSVAVLCYEALRQLDFPGLAGVSAERPQASLLNGDIGLRADVGEGPGEMSPEP